MKIGLYLRVSTMNQKNNTSLDYQKSLGVDFCNKSKYEYEVFEDVEDFIKKNKGLVTAAMQSVRDAVIDVLMDKVLKEVKKLVTDNIIKTQIEKVKYKKAQLASLVGVPSALLRQISGLVK